MNETNVLKVLFAMSEAYSRLELRRSELGEARYKELKAAYRFRGEALLGIAAAEDRRELAKKAP